DEMLGYAALDAIVPLYLADVLERDLEAVGLTRISRLEARCLPAVVWLEQSGIGWGPGRWLTLAAPAAAGPRASPGRWALVGDAPVAWNGAEQIRQLLRQRGHRVTSTDDDTLAKLDATDPTLIGELRAYRIRAKRVQHYGRGWAELVGPDDRVYASYAQM